MLTKTGVCSCRHTVHA